MGVRRRATTAASTRADDARIAAVRRFNRFYTRQIGVLRRNFLGSPYSLAEARVLYEIARGNAPTATDIGRALDLDAGYLSRVLRKFEKRGLIQRTASAHDARQSHLALTARGRQAYAPLERRSQRDIGAMLGRLPPDDQSRLIAAMDTIQALLGGSPDAAPAPKRGYRLRAPRPGDFGWIVKRHAELYAQEYGWVEPFEGVCAQIVADFANKNDPANNTIRSASAAGSPKSTARMSAASSWSGTRPRSPESGCCWSSRRRAGLGSAPGWSMNASALPAAPATKRSRCGRTAC